MQFYTVPNTPLVSQSPSSSSAFDRDPFDSLGTIFCESHESTAPLQPQWTQSSPASRAHRATAFDPEPTSTSLPALGPAGQQHGDSANPEDELTDSDLENELNDFGYGARAPRRRKEKKESLLDILNSEPPPWLSRPPGSFEPLETTPSIESKRSLASKLRKRLRASTTASQQPQPHQRQGRPGPVEDPTAGLTTLRSTKSSGNLFSSLRGKMSLPAPNLSTLPSSPGRLAASSNGPLQSGRRATQPPHMHPFDLPVVPPQVAASAAAPRGPSARSKMAAKEAARRGGDSTRDLVDFLRSSAGPADADRTEDLRKPDSLLAAAVVLPSSKAPMVERRSSRPVMARGTTSKSLPLRSDPFRTDPAATEVIPRPTTTVSAVARERFVRARSVDWSVSARSTTPPPLAQEADSVISVAFIQRTPPRAPPARRISRKPVPSVVLDSLPWTETAASDSSHSFRTASQPGNGAYGDDDEGGGAAKRIELVESPTGETHPASACDAEAGEVELPVDSEASHAGQAQVASGEPARRRANPGFAAKLRALQLQLGSTLDTLDEPDRAEEHTGSRTTMDNPRGAEVEELVARLVDALWMLDQSIRPRMSPQPDKSASADEARFLAAVLLDSDGDAFS